MSRPAWLPELLVRLPEETEAEYLDRVYQVFRADFLESTPAFRNCTVRLRKYINGAEVPPNGKEATFWHLMSEGETEEKRVPDFARCERLCWLRRMMDQHEAGNTEIRAWTQYRNGKTNVGLSIPNFEYVAFFGERRTSEGLIYYIPLTAYPAASEGRRTKYQKEWEKDGFFPPKPASPPDEGGEA